MAIYHSAPHGAILMFVAPHGADMAELEAVNAEEEVEEDNQANIQAPERKTLYETADDVMPQSLMPTWLPQRFAEELVEETDISWVLADFRVAECNNQHSDEGFEILMVAPDGTRMFIGEDATARDSNGLFGYIIEPDDRLPLVRTAQEAIDILKPAQATAAEMEGATPMRQGEWFLVPTDDEPVSRVFSGGVSERPFGGSPLENHVPTEFALGVGEEEFMDEFRSLCPEMKADTMQEAFERLAKAFRIAQLEDVELETPIPDFEEVRKICEPIYVRGTLRHRENDHYMESIGDQWHLAVTHDVDVFTIDTDDLTEEQPTVRLD